MSVSLAELQRRMQDSILKRNTNTLPHVKQTPRDTPEVMFGVYQNAYRLRLVEILGNDHPRLKCFMGDEDFARMGGAYVDAHPSDQPNARWFSRHLPEFLAKAWPWSRKPELSDLAILEKSLNDAFDAPEAPFLTQTGLAALDPGRFGDAVFAIHPSARRFTVKTNVTSIWSSMKCDVRHPLAEKLKEPMEILVWRQGSSARFRMLGAEEAMALDEAGRGVPFGVLCEMIAVMDDPDSAALRAASYLRGWIEAEIISAVTYHEK
jgi:Putative DNA-binding domain